MKWWGIPPLGGEPLGAARRRRGHGDDPGPGHPPKGLVVDGRDESRSDETDSDGFHHPTSCVAGAIAVSSRLDADRCRLGRPVSLVMVVVDGVSVKRLPEGLGPPKRWLLIGVAVRWIQWFCPRLQLNDTRRCNLRELQAELGRPTMMMSRSLDDQSLVEACRAGRTEAFDVLVERYQERLYPTILRLTGSPEDAEDVLQDAFVRAFEKLDQFQGESSFYTWVYRIAVNLALSGHRKRRIRSALRLGGRPLASRGAHPADESAESDPSAPLERAERERIVEDALNRLSPEHRAIVVLKDFDGHRYEEISAILDIPVGTVRSRLHRARCELRDRLRVLVDEPQPIRQGSTSVP